MWALVGIGGGAGVFDLVNVEVVEDGLVVNAGVLATLVVMDAGGGDVVVLAPDGPVGEVLILAGNAEGDSVVLGWRANAVDVGVEVVEDGLVVVVNAGVLVDIGVRDAVGRDRTEVLAGDDEEAEGDCRRGDENFVVMDAGGGDVVVLAPD